MTERVMGEMGHRRDALKMVEGSALGLFFVWIGIVLLADLGWGIGLLGIGVLVLGGQLARRQIARSFESFWLVVGTFFVLGGIWTLLDIRVSLMPVVSILAGLALLASALVGSHRHA